MTYEVKQMHYGPQWKRLIGGFARRSAAEAWLIDRACGGIVDRDVDERNDEISFMVWTSEGELHQYIVCRENIDA